MRLDPFSLPTSFEARDSRADGGTRHVEITRDRIVLHRSVQGMRMAINIAFSDFLGIALQRIDGAPMLILKHRDPSLSVPLADGEALTEPSALQSWSEAFSLPLLVESSAHEPSPRRRRHNAIRSRRPRILLRRQLRRDPSAVTVHHGEREIIAPE